MAENHVLITDPTMYTQTDPLKEVNDSSKNLVSGDFERQYRDRVMEKSGRRRNIFIVLSVCVGLLAVWTVVLTLVREVQISRLRREVDELAVNMIAMSVNIKTLNQKLANNKLFNEFMTLEDTIYADEDESPSKGEKHQESVEKLHDLTVLEDDKNMADDEEAYDDEDAESGDWYQDYDNRRQKIGTTNMVHLKPEDFTDAVLTFEKEKQDVSNIRELRRLLNENPENPDISKFQHSFSVQTPETKEVEHPPVNPRSKRSLFPDTTASEAIDQYPAPRSVAKAEERRKTKKFIPIPSVEAAPAPTSTQAARVAMHTVTRTVRSDNERPRGRPFIAAHFHGNTSHLSPEIHEHYKGNGLIRLAHGAAHDVWYPSPWTIASPHPRPTLMRNGHVHVHNTGVYLVYVQIYYLDSHDIISWVLHRTNADIEGRETLLQCAQSSHSMEVLDKPNSCFSAAALFLKAGDRLAVRNTGGDRHSLMEPEKSFIGLIKLADAEDPDQEF